MSWEMFWEFFIILTLIRFKWPEKVDKDWDKDCSSPVSAKKHQTKGFLKIQKLKHEDLQH
jgi:hypothetical protein